MDPEVGRAGQLAVAEWLDGRLDEAGRAFAHDIAGRRAAGLPTWGAWESYELNQVQHAQGQLDAAVRTCEQALEAVAESGLPPPDRGPGVRGAGRGGLPAERARPCAGVCDRGHRAVPIVCLHDATGGGPGHAGVDPASQGRSGRCPGCDGRSRASHSRPSRPAQPHPGAAGAVAPSPGRPGRSRPLDETGRPRRGRRAGLRPGTGAPGRWRASCWARPGPPRR